MADILIRGMDKPFHCFACNLSYLRGERLFCPVTKDEVLRYKIASDCPIQELPERWDLIDRDAIVARYREEEKRLGSDRHLEYLTVHDWIEQAFVFDLLEAPAIVPADKEESE